VYSLEWRRPPWNHQREAAEWLLAKGSGYLAFEMGGGKTYTAISAASAMGSERVLVACPKSVIGVWRREYEKCATRPFEILLLEKGTADQKAQEMRRFLSGKSPGTQRVVVVNYETAYRPRLGAAILAAGFGTVILDEAHRIKSPSGKASRFFGKLGARTKHRLCLSGTPMPHSPLDIWAQFRFLHPRLLGNSFTRFRGRYAMTHPEFPSKVLRWMNQDELRATISPHMRRVKTADVVDMPEILHDRIEVELGAKSRRAYQQLEDLLYARVDGHEIEAHNVLSKLLRQQQITGGEMVLDDQRIEFGTEKQDMLTDRLADIDQPVVVFYRFSADARAIEAAARKNGKTYGEVSGRRKDLTEHSEMPEGIDVMAVQESAGGVGIDLTRSHHGFWFSLSYSLGDYEQANARLHRPGQRNNVAMYHLVAKGTIDEAIYEALEKRGDVVGAIIERLHKHH